MLVARVSLRALRLSPQVSNNFARKKRGKGDDDNAKGEELIIKQDVKIDEKQVNKSAALYDQYVKSRQRPMLTLDNYQIKFVLILERDAIFLPHNPRRFQHYREKYLAHKKTGFYPALHKDIALDTADYLFTEYERVNPENEITHRNIISKTEVYQYAQHARYWKYTDPNIQDPHSVQTFSSHNVFLITKNKQGKWVSISFIKHFPTRTLSEKDNHKEIFTVMTNELFGGTGGPILYFPRAKPFYARKTQDSTLSRGLGYVQYFFNCYSLNGVPKFPTQNYLDYAWVPKAHISNYFDDEYFESTIKLAKHLF